MRLSDFDYDLPESSIARHPASRRDLSRLMVVDRHSGDVVHTRFDAIGEHLSPSDVLVANDTKVMRARLAATKAATGGRVEMLLIEPLASETEWRVMLGSSKPVREGAELTIAGAPPAFVERVEGDGFAVVRFAAPALTIASDVGTLPLPPYIDRPPERADEDRYQTIFARADAERSVAAPTAGLHFTNDLVAQLAADGIKTARVTLHVGPGTFLPVRTDLVEDHQMHSEAYALTEEAASVIESAKRVVAIGTTATRVLETVGRPVRASAGRTEIFLRPGSEFSVVGAMVTNFHLPRSTLLMLVSAFAGRELILDVYRRAVVEGYRFYSYGDAMLLV